MRILIVNGYDNNNLEKFQHFQYSVMKYLAEQKELIDTENEFYVRNRDSIEDFLYEIESSYVKRESALKFDQLDVIFVIGDSHTRPWNAHLMKILILLRMCLRVKKLLFASGFAMQALVYLSASNIDRPINLLNQNGGKLSDLRDLKLQIQQSDMFLENTSGDLYVFNYDTSEWVPKINVGLHLRSAAQEFQSIGKYIVKAPVYKPRNTGQQIFKNKNTETVVTVRNMYLQHWAFKDIPSRFLAPLLNRWDVHQFQFNNSNKKFISLAETDEGPSIIEYPKALACMFELDTKYPITFLFLKNFIHHAMYNIKVSSSAKPLESIENYQIQLQMTSTLMDLLKTKDKQQKKSTLELMQNRGHNGILANTNSKLTNQDQLSAPTLQRKGSMIAHVGMTLNKRVPINPVSVNAVGKRVIKQGQYHARKASADERLEYYQQSESDSSVNETAPPLIKTPRQMEIRKMLHPEISKHCLESTGVWIPGYYSQQKPLEKKTIKLLQRRRFVKSQITQSQTSMNNSQDISPKKGLILENKKWI